MTERQGKIGMSNPNIALRRTFNNNGRLYFPAAPFPHGIQMIFKEYDYKELLVTRAGAFGIGFRDSSVRTKAAQEASASIIELPMPTALQDSTGLIINGFERSFVESFVSDALAPVFSGESDSGFQQAANALFGMGEGAVQGAADLIGVISDPSKAAGDSQLGQLAAQGSKVLTFFMRNTLNNLGLGKSINAATGQAVNPQSTLSFEGVNLRAFQMEWTLYPESAAEANDIKKIIRTIKRQILPRTQSLTGSNNDTTASSALSRAFLKYPAVCFINLLGIDESSFVKFKPCMVDSISVDYGPSGAIVIAQGGVPQGVKISMSFKELEIQTAEDFEDNDTMEQN